LRWVFQIGWYRGVDSSLQYRGVFYLSEINYEGAGFMAQDKKFVEEITPMDQDFTQWYTDVIKKADLVDYSSVRGCMIIRPYGYAIWELIQKELDTRFKETGHENVYMPMFIPESLLQKEKDHVEGFAPEVAWVTHGGSEKLTERLCVRPTSETLFCDHYKNIIHSYRDLPKLYNQWCSVVRWEKTTRPFLRTLEFLWQEGHTAHANAEEAHEETIRMLNVYAEFCENVLAIPVVKGQKTEKEKFAGAKATYTIESLMHNGIALQSGTSHNFGDGFARAFDIQYTDSSNQLQYVHQTSWGMTTRLIGALIMVHGDDSGLVLPPKVAPVQVVVIPVSQHKEGVLEKASEICSRLSGSFRTRMDDSDKSPGWKFSEYEMKGVPVRLEIGPKDIEKGQVVLVRRDTREKVFVPMDELEDRLAELLDSIHRNLLEKATRLRNEKTYTAVDFSQFEKIINTTPGFIKAMWCGDRACEDAIKEKTGATSRCIPFDAEPVSDKCIYCGREAKTLVYWGKAY
jgi:prolyl-tRNA synthetase